MLDSTSTTVSATKVCCRCARRYEEFYDPIYFCPRCGDELFTETSTVSASEAMQALKELEKEMEEAPEHEFDRLPPKILTRPPAHRGQQQKMACHRRYWRSR